MNKKRLIILGIVIIVIIIGYFIGRIWYKNSCWNPYENETITLSNGEKSEWDSRGSVCKFADYFYDF